MSNKRKATQSVSKVFVGYLHPLTVDAAFHKSMTELLLWDAYGPRRIIGGGGRYSSANVSAGRNEIVADFLASKADWLLMVDSDMMFGPTLLDDLLDAADPDKYPIVGGLCFGVMDGELFPTLYGLVEGGQPGEYATVRYHDYPTDAMFQVAATGAACMVIHRSVCEAIGARGFNQAHPWYQETEMSGKPCGEDFTFCLRAGLCGFPVYVHTGIDVGHVKSQVLTRDMYEAQRAKAKPVIPALDD